MPYVPNTDEQRREMLAAIGVASFEDLLDSIPRETRSSELRIPSGLSEMEALEKMTELASRTKTLAPGRMFAGAGVYNHYIPPIVTQLSTRSEFFTAYTPYQPEVSQGLLQTTFEYQTYVCELSGLDVSNASSYDGATACADAVNIARAATRKNKVVFSRNVHPHYRQVFDTYNIGWRMATLDLPYSDESRFTIDADRLETMLSGKDVAAVVIQYPNFYGCFESGLSAIAELCHKHGALFAIGFYPFVSGWVKRPGDLGCDIAFAEGQPLGIPMGFGGPGLGMLAVKKDYVRFLPGRLIGKTIDENGKTAYVMTLQAREQHIRREKANSSICTNSALLALTATIYLSSIGKQGFADVGRLSSGAAHMLAKLLSEIPAISLAFPDAPFFNEFAIEIAHPKPIAVYERLIERGILPGVPLSKFGGLANRWLVATTEMHDADDIAHFAAAMREEMSK